MDLFSQETLFKNTKQYVTLRIFCAAIPVKLFKKQNEDTIGRQIWQMGIREVLVLVREKGIIP